MTDTPRLAAGDAIAAGGLVLSSFTLLSNTGPGYKALLAADPDQDHLTVDNLRRAEVATAAVVLLASAAMSALIRRTWPLGLAALALIVTVMIHEHALRGQSTGGCADCESAA